MQGPYPCTRLQRILLPLKVLALNQCITKAKGGHAHFEAVPRISTGTALEVGCRERAPYLRLPGALPDRSHRSHAHVGSVARAERAEEAIGKLRDACQVMQQLFAQLAAAWGRLIPPAPGATNVPW